MADAFAARVDELWVVPAVLKPMDAISRQGERGAKVPLSAREAKHLLDANPALAEIRARKSLEADPNDPIARYVLGGLDRRRRQFQSARTLLEPLTISQPQIQGAWFELGMALKGLGERAPACEALLRAVDLNAVDQMAWYELGDLIPFSRADAGRGADTRLASSQAALDENHPAEAENILNRMLKENGGDAPATKMLADVMLRTNRWAEFETLIERSIAIAPDFMAARFRYVTMCFCRGKIGAVLPHIEELMTSDPANALYGALKALVLYHGGQIASAVDEFAAVLARSDKQPGLWFIYAQALQSIRSSDAAAAAYRRAIDIIPSFGDAWLGLAQLASFRGDEQLIAQVNAQLARADLPGEDRAKLYYVLGRALENAKRYAEAFQQFESSNAVLRNGSAAPSRAGYIQRAKALFTPEFFFERAGWGCQEDGPIFIVGMPRSGSTLVEQILSSHSEVEALGELTIVTKLAKRYIPDRPDDPQGGYPNDVALLDKDSARLFGEDYLSAVRRLRRRDSRFFIDKLPSNYLHIGLIRLALPNAKILDMRRHPLDCGFSCFKHYFSAGLLETTDLGDIGRAYAEYVELMAHFDAVLPGAVQRVIYENLVGDFEPAVRRMLDRLGLPFQPQCLAFHENERFVRTLSAEQVNRPLYDTGIAHWRNYEPWLGELKSALGYVLDAYPDTPSFYRSARIRSRAPLSLGQSGYRFDFVRGVSQAPFAAPDQAE